MNKITILLDKNILKLKVEGDWYDFIVPTKEVLKLNYYVWNKEEEVWYKDMNTTVYEELFKKLENNELLGN